VLMALHHAPLQGLDHTLGWTTISAAAVGLHPSDRHSIAADLPPGAVHAYGEPQRVEVFQERKRDATSDTESLTGVGDGERLRQTRKKFVGFVSSHRI
jgi:hypothetical protein